MRDLAELVPMLPAVLDALASAGVSVVVVVDRDGELDRWYTNVHAATMVGYTVEELQEFPVIELIAPEQHPLVRQLSNAFMAGQPIPPVIELTTLHKDGARLSIEYSIGLHRLEVGVAYVMVLQLAENHHRNQLTLLEADRIGLVGALAAGFAHEINNPLTSVLLNLRSLRKQLGAMPPSTQVAALRCLDDITTGAERIASNVRALQTLATRSATQALDLAAVVASSLRLAAPTLEPRAQVIRRIHPVRAVMGEESRIGQAVLAMLLFSGSGFDGDASTADHQIEVAVADHATDIVVEVSDNGRDLTPDEVRSAFDPFFRSLARGAGVGVGLGVARSVATTLGGEVTLVPRPGGGVVITMRLPAAS